MSEPSEDFLREAWATARKNLPGWCFAALLNESRARSGGKARSKLRAAQMMRNAMNVVKTGNGVCIAFKIPQNVAEAIAMDGGEAVADLHLTLAYLGPMTSWSEDELKILIRTVAEHARGTKPLVGKISGAGKFNNDTPCIYASADFPGLAAFRQRIVTALDGAAINVGMEHDFDPHITLAYKDDAPPDLKPLEFVLDTLCVFAGDDIAQMKLDGAIQAVDLPASQPTAGKSKTEKSADVPTIGEPGSILFVGSSPQTIDHIRKEPFSGPTGETVNELYLKPLGLTRKDVAFTNVIPVVCKETEADVAEWKEWLTKEIERMKPRAVVALGRVAKQALGARADFALPHPAAVRKLGDSGEVARKLRAIRKTFDSDGGFANVLRVTLLDHHGARGGADQTSADGRNWKVPITKADEQRKIVYGVVLDPYVVDAHNDWIPPKEIEDTAIRYMRERQKISIHHLKDANGIPVESFVEAYPSATDRKKAFDNEPHRVYRRKFGDDYIHSGTWVLGTQLDDDLWAAYLRGEIQAYSIEGFASKTRVNPSAMPKVDIVDLVPSHDL